MHADLLLLKSLPTLSDPMLVSGFRVRRQGGRTSMVAITHLCEQWDAELVAKVSSDDFYDLQVYRPHGRYADGTRVIDWPETLIYLARPPAAKRDVFLVIGNEPNFRWKTYVEAILDFATGAGIKTLVNLRSLPAYVPHTRPMPVSLISASPALLQQFGLDSDERANKGFTDIAGVLSTSVQADGWQVGDLTTLQPYYFPRMPCSAAALALIRALDVALATTTDVTELEQATQAEALSISESVRGDADMRAAILKLERAYDSDVEKNLASLDRQLPSVQDTLDAVKRMLSERQ